MGNISEPRKNLLSAQKTKSRPATEPSRLLWPFFAVMALLAFGLNWLWEMMHMPAYEEMAGRSWAETAPVCAVASVGDVAVTFVVYGIGALAAGQLRWGLTRRWNIYATSALLGAAIAVAIEWRALALGRWSYSEFMPLLPVVGVGLWPVLQLTLLVPLSLWMAGWWTGPKQG